jgi:DNA polymerase elongation subunit (family B)
MTTSSLQFQLLGATTKDVAGAYQITLFGSTAEGKSVSLNVTGFEPFFFIEIPEAWTTRTIATYQLFLTKELKEDEVRTVSFTIEKHKSFWDFNDNREDRFLKVQTESKKLWTKLRDICQDKVTALPIPVPPPLEATLRVFEANIDPLLRFFHIREIKPAGWVTVASWEDDEESVTTTAIQAITSVENVVPASDPVQLTVAPLKMMSWDIECTSSHGDFPLAIKTWRKPARELIECGLTAFGAAWPIIQDAIEGRTAPISRIYMTASPTAIAEVTASAAAVERGWPKDLGGEDAIDKLEALLTKTLPSPDGDPIIQIGSVVYVNSKPVRKDIFVLGTCTKVAGPEGGEYPVNTYPVKTEHALIRGWCKLIEEIDPDCMIGYNIFGFDDKYLWDRASVNHCNGALRAFSRVTDKPVRLQEKFLSSSAMGDNTFYVITGEGRLHIDLLAYVRRNSVLDSYSLDNVTATFMAGSVATLPSPKEGSKDIWIIPTKSTKGTIPGRSVVLMDEENDVIGEKLEVVTVEPKALHVRMPDGGAALRDHGPPPVRWSQSKDDVSPKDIFALHGKGPADRAKVAKYCIQDCDLVMELFQKLEVFNNSVAMANVCWVPVEFIFTRGQGIKSESLVFYECRKEDRLIPVLPAPPPRDAATQDETCPLAEIPEVIVTKNNDDIEGYEGAIVLDPLTGIYFDDEPVAALDFSSLYPSSEISENMSHDSVVSVKDYDLTGNFVAIKEGSDRYDNLPTWDYLNVEYDILKPDPADKRKHPELKKAGRRVVRFAQHRDPSKKSTLPKILMKLLGQRKAVRKQAEKETDEFRKALLDALQLAYKLTANSLYGQMGSNTSKIRRKCIAASTTAHGRDQIMFSKAVIEAGWGPAAGDPRCEAVCVYGDTDSLFISFKPKDPATGKRLTGRKAQEAAKELAEEAGHAISGALKPPHDFEFDKMFRCFCLLSKKRYVGDMTEGGLEDSDYHRKSMGIVMKRRDNAPIVKYVYGGAIELILAQRNIEAAFHFVRKAATELLAGAFSMKRLTITKSLKAEYKLVPAHKILADRIGKRDPGNKPASNDRIPYAYAMRPDGKPWPKTVSQGDRIEMPSYIKEKGLKPDYMFYITNQIAKPVAQVFALVLERLPGIKTQQLTNAAKAKDPVAAREKLAEDLLFGDLLRKAQGQTDLRSFFSAA